MKDGIYQFTQPILHAARQTGKSLRGMTILAYQLDEIRAIESKKAFDRLSWMMKEIVIPPVKPLPQLKIESDFNFKNPPQVQHGPPRNYLTRRHNR